MNSAKRYLAIAFTFVLAVATISILNPRVAHALVATLVQVTNTSANPVPTQAVGTTPVSGTVAIDPNSAVNVSSLPAVQLAGGSSVTLGGNSNTQPLFVRDVDNPALQPFTLSATCNIPGGKQTCLSEMFVPQGKRAVIETATVAINGVNLTTATVQVIAENGSEADVNGNQGIAYFTAKDFAVPVNDVNFALLVGTSKIRLYANPGSAIDLVVSTPTEQFGAQARLTIVGYYVNVP